MVPTFNERENLPTLVRSLLEHPDYRVLVVDDGSPDGTGALANALSDGTIAGAGNPSTPYDNDHADTYVSDHSGKVAADVSHENAWPFHVQPVGGKKPEHGDNDGGPLTRDERGQRNGEVEGGVMRLRRQR